MNDIVLNKKESIERCVKQIRAYYALPREKPFAEDFLRQDAIAANLQRACEQCIDLANYTIRKKKLGLPKASKDCFRLLAEHRIIGTELSANLEKMVGFRNTLVHDYQKLNVRLMIDVIEKHLDDLLDFTTLILKTFADTDLNSQQ